MALIGVSHCPACGAVVNTSWQTCLACSSILERSNPKSTPLQAQAPMESVEPQPKRRSSQSTVQPGMTVQYRIPVRITSPTKYEWEWHCGTIELVDEDWQMVLIIPETEGQPWRWVAMYYIQHATS